MPLIPWSDLDPATRRFPASRPSSGLLNRALDGFCSFSREIGQWTAAVYRSAGIPSGAAGWLAGLPITDLACGTPGYPPVPPVPGVPPFPENCATFGTVDFRTNISGSLVNPQWVAGQDVWDCNANIGRPIGQPRWVNFGGSTWGYAQTFERPDGSGTVVRSFGQTPFGDVQERVQILNINIQYCPGCGLPPPPPVPPIIPERPDDPDPDDPPIIDIDIDFPIAPGLPPLVFPVLLSPRIDLNFPISLQPNLTLAPRVDLNPNFNFVPTFEFNFGGISIGGGGYPEPRRDVEDLVDCDCPDPCPPGGDVDYERIRLDNLRNLAILRDRPGELTELEAGESASGLDVFLELPPGCVGVRYELDLDEYTGDVVFGRIPQTTNYYAGWYWFGDGVRFGGDRQYFTASSGFLPVPPFARSIAASCRKGASVTLVPVVPVIPEE